MLVKELHQLAGGVIRLDGERGAADAGDPFGERDDIGVGNIERVGEDGDHLAPGLLDGIVDVVDWVGGGVGDEEVAEGGGDVVDWAPG